MGVAVGGDGGRIQSSCSLSLINYLICLRPNLHFFQQRSGWKVWFQFTTFEFQKSVFTLRFIQERMGWTQWVLVSLLSGKNTKCGQEWHWSRATDQNRQPVNGLPDELLSAHQSASYSAWGQSLVSLQARLGGLTQWLLYCTLIWCAGQLDWTLCDWWRLWHSLTWLGKLVGMIVSSGVLHHIEPNTKYPASQDQVWDHYSIFLVLRVEYNTMSTP